MSLRIPDEQFNAVFAGLRYNRDRAVLAFWVSTAARYRVADRSSGPGESRRPAHRSDPQGERGAAVAAGLIGRVRLAPALSAGPLAQGRCSRPHHAVVTDAPPPVPAAHLPRRPRHVCPRPGVAGLELDAARPASYRGLANGPRPRHATDRRSGDQNSYDIPFPYAVVTQRMEYLEDGTVQFGT
jgi:hypothetical protein